MHSKAILGHIINESFTGKFCQFFANFLAVTTQSRQAQVLVQVSSWTQSAGESSNPIKLNSENEVVLGNLSLFGSSFVLHTLLRKLKGWMCM